MLGLVIEIVRWLEEMWVFSNASNVSLVIDQVLSAT